MLKLKLIAQSSNNHNTNQTKQVSTPLTMTQGYYLPSSRYEPPSRNRSTYQQPPSAFDWDSSSDERAHRRNHSFLNRSTSSRLNRSQSNRQPQRDSPSPDRFFQIDGLSGNGLNRRGAIGRSGQSESRFARERGSQRSTGASSGILSGMLRGLGLGSSSSSSSSQRSRSTRNSRDSREQRHTAMPSRQPSRRDDRALPNCYLGSDGVWVRGDTGRPLDSRADGGLRRSRSHANPYTDPYTGAHSGHGRASHDISNYEGMPQRMLFSRGQHPSARRSRW